MPPLLIATCWYIDTYLLYIDVYQLVREQIEISQNIPLLSCRNLNLLLLRMECN